ncbi:MAG: tRNA (guanosine(37)-N1)-methyltransferase TrmD [bacterium]
MTVPFKVYVLSLFPQDMQRYFLKGIMAKAVSRELVDLSFIDLREFSELPHRSVDDYPVGERLGMLLRVDVIAAAIRSIPSYQDYEMLCPCPKGALFDQSKALGFSKHPKGLIFLCGYYEGIDERVFSLFPFQRLSMGDMVLSSGELPTLLMMDAVLRLIPGVLGNPESVEADSFSDGLLEHPHYTKPLTFEGCEVPAVLSSGHHQKIQDWKFYHSLRYTLYTRPDLVARMSLTEGQQRVLKQVVKAEEPTDDEYN